MSDEVDPSCIDSGSVSMSVRFCRSGWPHRMALTNGPARLPSQRFSVRADRTVIAQLRFTAADRHRSFNNTLVQWHQLVAAGTRAGSVMLSAMPAIIGVRTHDEEGWR